MTPTFHPTDDDTFLIRFDGRDPGPALRGRRYCAS
jgi:hypothetical protein